MNLRKLNGAACFCERAAGRISFMRRVDTDNKLIYCELTACDKDNDIRQMRKVVLLGMNYYYSNTFFYWALRPCSTTRTV